METYSVKGAPGAGPDATAKKKNGQKAWTAQEIMEEAERKRLASLHVGKGGPPPEIMAGEVSSFDALRDAHVAAAARKESFRYTKKDGTVQTRRRKLRADAPTLHTTIVSLPVTSLDALADPALLENCRGLLRKAMEDERKRLDPLGGKMMMGVIHLDERMVHAHFYALDPMRGRVDHLHPGKAAKADFHLEHKDSEEDPKDVRKAGNRAYCDAMRAWQDSIHENVFSPAGLLRRGPRATRLSTAEYNKLKAAKEQQAKDAARSAKLAAQIGRQEDQIRKMLREAGAEAQDLTRQSVELQADKVGVLVQASEAATTKARGEEEIERGARQAADAEALKKAMLRGWDAVENREVDYQEKTEEKREGLKFGPNAPVEKNDRASLIDAILPAYDFVLDIAKRAFGRREDEAARETARRKEEAELRRRAAVVAEGLERSQQAVPEALREVANAEAATYSEASFPGAWAISPGADPKKVGERLNATTNLDLRAAYMATRDAVRLLEGDAPLRAKFEIGMQVLEGGAAHRGFDLNTGRQDIGKALSPDLAARHRDQIEEGPKVKRKDRTLVR
ncbi:hypothetical protein ACSQ76_15795 [Roseovarius sp. B08]|uniref:hypothetical protein n=1 Tax=Roseovarius sp. B08 TaxID=3449223 RepID=UPI003EDCB20E